MNKQSRAGEAAAKYGLNAGNDVDFPEGLAAAAASTATTDDPASHETAADAHDLAARVAKERKLKAGAVKKFQQAGEKHRAVVKILSERVGRSDVTIKVSPEELRRNRDALGPFAGDPSKRGYLD